MSTYLKRALSALHQAVVSGADEPVVKVSPDYLHSALVRISTLEMDLKAVRASIHDAKAIADSGMATPETCLKLLAVAVGPDSRSTPTPS